MADSGDNGRGSGGGVHQRGSSLDAGAQAFVPSQHSGPPVHAPPLADIAPALPPLVGLGSDSGPAIVPPPIDIVLGPQGLSGPPPPGLGWSYIPPAPIIPGPGSVGSDDDYVEADDMRIPEPPWVGLRFGLSHLENQALQDVSAWTPVRPEPIGNVPHKILPDFKDPRWTGPLRSSYVPYWTSPSWDMRMEEDWRGEVYMQRVKPEDRVHYGRPAILQQPIDQWVTRTDYAL